MENCVATAAEETSGKLERKTGDDESNSSQMVSLYLSYLPIGVISYTWNLCRPLITIKKIIFLLN